MLDSNVDSLEFESPPVKAKKRKVLQKYRAEYTIKYPVIARCSTDETCAHCKLCRCDFSIGHGGLGDVEKHIRTTKHTTKAGNVDRPMRKIQQFFTDSKDLGVMNFNILLLHAW